ncbi:DUF397 domain-containing protein [Streptomyces sp. NPDC050523]|uniref:DUF397 domain-containing protein n=1 Tax=Streptomyces sp. NPDC050523 TaxID=3365622 RepID=UPI00378C1188
MGSLFVAHFRAINSECVYGTFRGALYSFLLFSCVADNVPGFPPCRVWGGRRYFLVPLTGNGGGAVIRPADRWKKSSYSEQGACVEVAWRDVVRVRDSKQSSPPEVEFAAGAWSRFVEALQTHSSLP